MNWLQSVYEVIGAPYPRLSIVVAAMVGAFVFGGGWWLVGRQHAKDNTPPATAPVSVSTTEGQTLLPQQQRLLELLAGYQRQFAASKLVISRSDGSLQFDGTPDRAIGVSVIRDLYGTVDGRNAGRFEELIESMPPDYVRLIAEARWDNPFVVNVTPAGVKRLGDSP